MANTEQQKDFSPKPDTRSIPVKTVDQSPVVSVETPIVGDTARGDGSGWKWPYDKPEN